MTSQILTIVFLVLGTAVIFLSALGVLRFPDIYCRSHALGKSMPLGINLMLIGAWIYLGHDLVGFKTFLAILFQAVSIPVATHILALLAFKKNIPRWKEKPVDRHDESVSGRGANIEA